MKKRHVLFLLPFFLLTNYVINKDKKPKPTLVIGIVIDQMRYDYLTKFSHRYGAGGFNRLLKEGFSLENAHFNYIPTYTAVGHASIYTGTTPVNHGIIGNHWYDKSLSKSIYCVDDANFKTIGNEGEDGKKSPYRLQTTTVTDQLKLAQNNNGKVIGIGIKDRSSILPVGHAANAAYWYAGEDRGEWISSSYYMENLPTWVTNFNKSGKAATYLKKEWNTLYDIDTYTSSIEDDNNFEEKFKGERKPVFPHDIPKLRSKNGNFSILKKIPAGNSFTTDFAKATILNENLGKGSYTDFLAISYSSTDYVGHQFGVASKEIEDTYLRLDKDLESLLTFLDTQVGKENYTLFLTADHAAVHVPSYLQSLKIPGGYFNTKKFTEYLNKKTEARFNVAALIENISNFQLFLNKQKINDLKLNHNEVAEFLTDEAINYDGIYKAVSAKTMQTNTFTNGILNTLQNGYNQKFSGDVLLVPNPNTINYMRKGSTHGSGYSYDTHIPVIFYGNGIQQGNSKKKYHITDIAPTISNLLEIEFPNGNTGLIIDEVLK